MPIEETGVITSATLENLEGVQHGFFTRQGGVSGGIYASLNIGIGSDDERASVLENRGRAAVQLGAEIGDLALPYQIHSADVITVEEPWGPGMGPKGDAVATNRPGVVVGISTADCGPVLFTDPSAGVVAAAHAGWQGAFGGVLEATLTAMENLGARRGNISATLGPTISGNAYEVGPEFVDRFIQADGGNKPFFSPSTRAGHAMFDLPAYILQRLSAAGVGQAENLDLCTYKDAERFYSYRRATHHGEADYGRLLSAITLCR